MGHLPFMGAQKIKKSFSGAEKYSVMTTMQHSYVG